jgi:hypothetical protein
LISSGLFWLRSTAQFRLTPDQLRAFREGSNYRIANTADAIWIASRAL